MTSENRPLMTNESIFELKKLGAEVAEKIGTPRARAIVHKYAKKIGLVAAEDRAALKRDFMHALKRKADETEAQDNPDTAADQYASLGQRAVGLNPAIAAPYGKKSGHAQDAKIDHNGPAMSPYTIGLPGDLHHSTTVLVLDTANLMGQKLMNAQAKYGLANGWQDANWKNPKEGATFTDGEACREHAFGHLLKGDPIDVVNYMAFMLHHGWSCAPQTSEEASGWIDKLREKFDLVDDNQQLRQLMDLMEERHGEEFNRFFEVTIRQVMLSLGINQLRLSTSGMFDSFTTGPRLVVKEDPGYLTYELVEEVTDVRPD